MTSWYLNNPSIRIAVICGSIRMHVADTMLYIDRATTAHHSGWETMYLAVDEITFLTFCPATVLVVIISVQRPHKTIAINKNPLYILFCNILYGKCHLFDNYDDSYARKKVFWLPDTVFYKVYLALSRMYFKWNCLSNIFIGNQIRKGLARTLLHIELVKCWFPSKYMIHIMKIGNFSR